MAASLTGVVPVVPTIFHDDETVDLAGTARVAAMRSRDAQDRGAAAVMMMPPFFGATLSVAGPAVIEYFKTVADAIDIPIMVQDAPLSSTPLPTGLLID